MADLSVVGMLSPSAAPYFGWDMVRDVHELLRYAFMQHAFEAGTVVALTSAAGVLTLLALVIAYRPLLFTTLDEEVAEAKGVPVRGLSIAFMVILAVAVSEAVQVVGVLLIFALIVAPAAIAERVTSRPSHGILVSAALAVLFTWAGLTVAYYVPYPVGFFITTFAFVSYVVARLLSYLGARRTVRTRGWREAQVRHSP